MAYRHHRAEHRRSAHLRRRRTIALNSLRQLAEAACAYRVGGRDWPGWLAEAEAIAARCPTRKTVGRPALEAVVAELERRRRDGDAALRAAFAIEDEDADGALAGAKAPALTPGQEPAERSPPDERAPRRAAGNLPPAAEPIRTSFRQPSDLTRPEPAESATNEAELPITPRLVLRAAPSLRPYLRSRAPTWAAIVAAADEMRGTLGIGRPAWAEACAALGGYDAAVAVAVIAAKGAAIHSPEGYLRGMIARHQAGALRLARSVHSLAGALPTRRRAPAAGGVVPTGDPA